MKQETKLTNMSAKEKYDYLVDNFPEQYENLTKSEALLLFMLSHNPDAWNEHSDSQEE